MASRFLLGLVLLLILCLTRGAVGECREPPKNINLARENLEDDIVMTIVSTSPNDKAEWSVKSSPDLLTSGDPDASPSHQSDSFSMVRTGPFWNLVTTKGLLKPEAKKDQNMFKIRLEIECTERQRHIVRSYTIEVSVISEQLLEKVPITVPENTPVGHAIYFDKVRSSNDGAEYSVGVLSKKRDTLDAFELDTATGSVTLVKPLDYESDLKVTWLLVIKGDKTGTKFRLFRIEIGNVNDNAPQFLMNEKCRGQAHCRVVKYNYTLDTAGVLKAKDGNIIHAIDPDENAITYSIISAIPEQNFITINKQTGELKAIRPKTDAAQHYLLTIKASDGRFETTVTVAIDVEKLIEINAIMKTLGIGRLGNAHEEEKAKVKETPKDTLIQPSQSSAAPPPSEIRTTLDYINFLKQQLVSSNSILPSGIRMKIDSTASLFNVSGSSVGAWESNATDMNGNYSNSNNSIATAFRNGTEVGDLYLFELCANITRLKGSDKNVSISNLLSRNGSSVGFQVARKLCSESGLMNVLATSSSNIVVAESHFYVLVFCFLFLF